MKKLLAIVLALSMVLSITDAFAEADMSTQLIEAAKGLAASENLHFDNGLEISGMGVHFNNYPKNMTDATIAFMQCLFAGQPMDSLDDTGVSFYSRLSVVNAGPYYAMPQTLETEAYEEYRAE